MPQVIVIPFDGQEVGQGFNSETRESVGTGLSVTDIGEDKVADGQDVITSFQIITDQDSLMESLGVSASLDARYMLFSGDAKVSFSEAHAVNSYSSFVVGRCLVQNARRHGHGFKLTPDTDALLHKPNGMEEFKTAFGDMFVRSLDTGGEFLVVARITSISEEHQHALAASLHAEYNSFVVSVSFNAAYNKAVSETNNHTEVTVWMDQRGGQGVQASFTGSDATKILARLADFPTSAHEHPVGYEAELANYNTIPIPIPPLEEREDQAIVLIDCKQQKIGFLRALSNLDLALSDDGPNIFDDTLPSRDDLTAMKGQYRIALNALMSHAIRVSTGQMNPPQTFVANPAPPAINFKKRPFAPPPTPSATISVPDVLDEDTALAQATLDTLGLLSTVVISNIPGPPPNTVADQNPPPGAQVSPGSTVTLFVTPS
jgi:hypothetical protein